MRKTLRGVRRWCTNQIVSVQNLPGVAFNAYTRGTPLESNNCAGTDETFGYTVKTVFKLLSSQFYKAAGIEQKSDRKWHEEKDVP